MTLLQEIQQAAVSSEVPLPDLLRRCKILATRLGNHEFKAWVDHELNGYPTDESLPDYRVLSIESKGHFSGFAGSGLRNAPIPPSNIPKEFREIATTARCREPISSLVELLRGGKKSNFQSPWPADLVKRVSTAIYEHMTCMSAWREIPRGGIVAIVDTVRNRILSFVLELESQDPTVGESDSPQRGVSQERVSQVFQTFITGNVGNFAAGGDHIEQTSLSAVREGDLNSLKAYLTSIGVNHEDVRSLEEALAIDAAARSEKQIGERTGGWLGRLVSKASSGALEVSTSVASNVLAKAIGQYLGLPPG